MATIRELVVQTAQAKLNDAAKPATMPTTERARTFALEPSQLISSILYPLREEPQERRRGDPSVLTTIDLALELRAKGDGVSAPDVLLDPCINWVVKALCGYQEASRWHGIEYVETDFKWEQADYAFCLATVRLRVLTQIKTNDPSAMT